MTSLADTNGSTFTYAFDGEGNRISQSLNDCLTTRFVYDAANAVMEINASNEVVRAYINGQGMDQPIERIGFIDGTARQRQVFHADGLGSIAALTDESGEPVQTYTYAAFGGIRAGNGSDLNRITYTAREALGDSLGFYFYRNRVFDSRVGRFTSEDPLGFIDGPNRYVYCSNNPMNLIDPFGLSDIWQQLIDEGDSESYCFVPSAGQPKGEYLPAIAFGAGAATYAYIAEGIWVAITDACGHVVLHFLHGAVEDEP